MKKKILKQVKGAAFNVIVGTLSAATPLAQIIDLRTVSEPFLAWLGIAGLVVTGIYSTINVKDALNEDNDSSIDSIITDALKQTVDSQTKQSYKKLARYLEWAITSKIKTGEITNEISLINLYQIITDLLTELNNIERTENSKENLNGIFINFKLNFYKQISYKNIEYGTYQNMINIDRLQNEMTTLEIKIEEIINNKLNEKLSFLKQEHNDIANKEDIRERHPISLPKCKKGLNRLIGRDHDLKSIANMFKNGYSVILINSIGGVGKTELCKYYCVNYTDESGWFDYEVDMKTTLLKLSDKSEFESHESREEEYRRIEKHLKTLDETFTLVFDNIYSLEQYELDLICQLSCNVLLTSREVYPSHNRIFKKYDLPFLSNEKCIELFDYFLDNRLQSFKKESRNLIFELVDLAGRHTLVIELLAKLYDTSFSITVTKLLSVLKRKGFDIPNKVYINGIVSKKAFNKHMMILFDICNIKDKKKLYLLKNICLLPPVPVEGEIVLSWLGLKDESDLIQISQTGWIKNEEGYAIMHNVICDTLKMVFNPRFDECVNLVNNLVKEIEYDEYNLAAYRPKYINQCTCVADYFYNKTNSDILSNLYYNIGYIYTYIGEYNNALEYYKKDLATVKTAIKKNNIDIAFTYNNIGIVYSYLDNRKAGKYYKKALRIRRRYLPINHEDIINSYNVLGLYYYDLSNYNLSLKYYNKCIELKLTKLNNMDTDLAYYYNNIALTHLDNDNPTVALVYMIKSLRIRLSFYEQNHPVLATTYNNLGEIYSELGDYEKALEYHEKDLNANLKILGDKHPSVATSYNNIGIDYDYLGNQTKALECFEKSLKISKIVYGNEHIDISVIYNNMGESYRNLGNTNKALKYYFKSLMIDKNNLKPNHINFASTYNNIGMIYMMLYRYDLAIQYLRRSIKVMKRVFSKNNKYIVQSYIHIAMAYYSIDKLGKALRYFKKVKTFFINLYGEYNLQVAEACIYISSIYYYYDSYNKALNNMLLAFLIQKEKLGLNDENTKDTFSSLKDIYKESNKLDCDFIGWYKYKSGEILNKTVLK